MRAIKAGDFVRLRSREGWWPVWMVLSERDPCGAPRVMYEDGDAPGWRLGPASVTAVWEPEATELHAESRKKLADAQAEYMLVESALVDAMGALQFYAEPTHWLRMASGDSFQTVRVQPAATTLDAGKRARVLLDRIFDRLVAFARIQKLRG